MKRLSMHENRLVIASQGVLFNTLPHVKPLPLLFPPSFSLCFVAPLQWQDMFHQRQHLCKKRKGKKVGETFYSRFLFTLFIHALLIGV